MSSSSKPMSEGRSISGPVSTPMRVLPANDMEDNRLTLPQMIFGVCSEKSRTTTTVVTVKRFQGVAQKIIGGSATPIRCQSSMDWSINYPRLYYHNQSSSSTEHRQLSSSKVFSSGCKSYLGNLGKHCCQWIRQICKKLEKKCPPGVCAITGAQGNTDTDIEMGTNIYAKTDMDIETPKDIIIIKTDMKADTDTETDADME